MYFEADMNGVKYEINVNEARNSWKVSLKPENEAWIHYDIPKEDYKYMDDTISFLFKNSSYLVDVVGSGTDYDVYSRGSYRVIKIYNEENLLHESLKGSSGFGLSESLTAGMPGKIVKIMVKPGQEVKKDEPLLIMEAMKMENEMRASADTTIDQVLVEPGQNVEGGAVLITFKND